MFGRQRGEERAREEALTKVEEKLQRQKQQQKKHVASGTQQLTFRHVALRRQGLAQ